MRDTTLVSLGVRLEDRPDGHAVWKLDDPELMRQEAEERQQQQAEAVRKKLMVRLGGLAGRALLPLLCSKGGEEGGAGAPAGEPDLHPAWTPVPLALTPAPAV